MASPTTAQDSPPVILASYRCSADETRRLVGDVPADSRFPIGSVTKTLTALVAARLSIDGVVSWTAPLATATGSPSLTLQQLLTHTASIPFELRPEHWTGPSLTGAELDQAMATVPRIPVPPGTWHYSNLGYAMAAHALERATGRTFAELLAEHLLEPIGMTRTSFPDPRTEGQCVLGAAAPAGDLFSTFNDLMLLARALEGHASAIVTRPMVAMLLDSAVPADGGGYLGAGIRIRRAHHHRVLVSTGAIRDRTTCLVAWPGRGSSILLADRGYSHEALSDAGVNHWRPHSAASRSWWWDGQEVVELRHGGVVELVLRETTWPYPLFTGRVQEDRLVGVDWRGQPLVLTDRGGALIGQDVVLTASAADSAYSSTDLP